MTVSRIRAAVAVASSRHARAAASIAGVLLLATGVACGHRGNPRPPVYPEPPAMEGLVVGQRGGTAILRFPAPPTTAEVGGEEVRNDAIEVMVYAERYPVLDAETLIAGLRQRRDLLVEEARLAAARAEQERLRQEQAAAGAAGEAGAEEPRAGAAAGTAPRTPEETLLRSVPPAVLATWREARLPQESVLAAARQLQGAVVRLWQDLGLPTTILDPARPPALPPDAQVATRVPPVLASLQYERPMDWQAFQAAAGIPYRIPVDELERYRVGGLLQVAHEVGRSVGEIRTRYFFGVRTRSDRGRAGLLRAVVPMVPAAVPVAPTGLVAEITEAGVELEWLPPAGDLMLRRLDPTDLGYNVYRARVGAVPGPDPLNPAPLTEPSFVDSTMEWNTELVYEVRALTLPPLGPARKESEGARVEDVEVLDFFAPGPVTDARAERTGAQVIVQWTNPPAPDLVNTRVWRQAAPAPPEPVREERGLLVPQQLRVLGAEEGDAGGEGGAAAGAAGQGAAGEAGAAGEERQAGEPVPDPDAELRDAGWELIAEVPGSRTVDRDLEEGVRYVYLVEAVDARGNRSVLVRVEER